MKKQWKGFVSGVLLALLVVSLTSTALATVGRRAVDADYNDITVTLNGKTVELVDANGNPVEPFAINGTTYLPVRAVASALGLEVGWDQATTTVILTSKAAQAKAEYAVGETWTVEGQWSLTVDSIEETDYRNPYTDKDPAAVYIVTYTYTNLGYESDFMDGLYFSLEDSIVDCQGTMGYSYPGNITKYPQETPVGATCTGQVCIGVDHAGTPIRLGVAKYDGTETKQTATFIVE